MKTLVSFGAMLAVLGVAIVPLSAQTQSTNVQVSKLVGTKVKSSQGEEIGTIKDVVIDRSTGCMAYTVLATGEGGARTAGGGKMVAVPWAVYSPESDISALTVTVDRQRIYSAPVFEYARIDEYSRPDYITNVYSYYGVSQGPGVGVSGTTTTTGVSGSSTTTGTAGATGRTGATGSPPQASSPPAAGTRSPAERESPAGRASPSPRATSARGRATVPPREREGAESSPAREERDTRARPGETESPSSGTREERGTRPQPGESRSPSGGTELQREPSEATRESPSEATSSDERTREGNQKRPHRKPERREANTPPPEGGGEQQ